MGGKGGPEGVGGRQAGREGPKQWESGLAARGKAGGPLAERGGWVRIGCGLKASAEPFAPSACLTLPGKARGPSLRPGSQARGKGQ